MPRNPFRQLRAGLTNATVRRGGADDFFNLPILQTGDLRKGDILLVKLYEDYAYWEKVDRLAPYAGMGKDGNYILLAQALFSHISHGSATSEHVMMCSTDGHESVYESVGVGVIETHGIMDRYHAVYRFLPGWQNLITEAAKVGRSLARGVRPDGTLSGFPTTGDDGNTASVNYRSKKGMIPSPFRLKTSGPLRNIRIKRVHDAVYGNDESARNGLRMICSEFVATCYEVAAYHLNINPSPLNVDPRGMTAKALQAVLDERCSYIELKGIYKGAVPIVKQCGTCNGQVRCMYLMNEHGKPYKHKNSTTGKTGYPYVTICPSCNRCPGCNEVWCAAPHPGGNGTIVFFCFECDGGYPSNDEGNFETQPGVLQRQGGHAQTEGTMKKPKKNRDEFFIR